MNRIELRLPLTAPGALTPEPFVAIFGRWRTGPAPAAFAGLVDLADYAHVICGPRAVLVGRRFHLRVVWEPGGVHLGFSWLPPGPPLSEVLAGSLAAAQALLAQAELAPFFVRSEPVLELKAPQVDEAELRTALDAVLGLGRWSAEAHGGSGQRIGWR